MAPTLPKVSLPKLALPKLSLGSKQLQMIVGGIIVLGAAAWFGWQYLMEEPPAPPPPPPAAAKAGPAKAAPPAETPATQAKLVEDVLAASGLKQQLSQLPQQLVASIAESGKQRKAPPAVAKAMEKASMESYGAINFQDRVGADLKKNFDRKRLQALLNDFSTPVAKRMTELEQSSPSPAELAQYARTLAATPLSPQRVSLIKRIDAASKASDLALNVAFVSMKAVVLGIAGEGAQKAAAAEKAIEKARDAMTNTIRNATLLNLAFSYKSASDADLEEYAKMSETENSKWFSGIVYASLAEEINSASAQAGKRLGELLSKPAAPAGKAARSKAGADARSCLSQATNAAIMKCAEQYR